MKLLKSENTKLYQKIQILYEESNVLKDLAKLQSNDEMARQVAKKELAMEKYKKKRLKFSDESEKKSIKRFKKRNVQSDSKESDGSEYKRIIQKKRKRQVKKQNNKKIQTWEESDSSKSDSDNEISSDSEEKQIKSKKKIG